MKRVLDGQSIFDLSAQHCGGVEASLAMAILNGVSVTDTLAAGIAISTPDPVDKDIQNYYQSKGLTPATSITTLDESQTIADEGIEFWAIEVDFIVS